MLLDPWVRWRLRRAKRRFSARVERMERHGAHAAALGACEKAAREFGDGDPEFESALALLLMREDEAASCALVAALARGPQLALEVKIDPRFVALRRKRPIVEALRLAEASFERTTS